METILYAFFIIVGFLAFGCFLLAAWTLLRK